MPGTSPWETKLNKVSRDSRATQPFKVTQALLSRDFNTTMFKSTTQWYKTQCSAEYVNILDWSALSSYLNTIKNIWNILTHEVYNNRKQYFSTEELKVDIGKTWHSTNNI